MPLTPGDIAIFRTKPYLKGGVNSKAGLNGTSNDLFGGLKSPTASNPDTINFNKEVLKAKRSGKFSNSTVYGLGKTKDVLNKVAGEYNITVSGAALNKAMTKDEDHVATFEHFINLADNLNSPVAIFKSKTEKDALVVLTELITHKEKPLLVAIHLNDSFKIFKIASVYSKTNKNIFDKWRKEGLLIYKKKSFSSLLSAPIAVSQTTKGQHKSTKKTQTIKNRGLKSPVIPLLPDNEAQVPEETPDIIPPPQPQAATENTDVITPRTPGLNFLNVGNLKNNFFNVALRRKILQL